jgi:hypothetical protein
VLVLLGVLNFKYNTPKGPYFGLTLSAEWRRLKV